MDQQTKAWKLYEKGKKYNNQLKPNYYDMVDTNWAFFNGDQWRNLEVEDMPQPVFNIIKRTIQFLVASLTSSRTKINFEPLTGTEGLDPMDDSQLATAQVNNLLEKFKFDSKEKDILFDAAITGDAAAHFYFDLDKRPFGESVKLTNGMKLGAIEGEICMDIVDGTNVYFGNANNSSVQCQPYIIISGREMVKKLKEEKKQYAKLQQSAEDGDIKSDNQVNDMAGDSGKIEIESELIDGDEYGKAQYIILYEKKRMPRASVNAAGRKEIKEVETIVATKSTEKTYIYEELDTQYSKYPIAWMNWEKRKNSYHGISQCGAIISNQIFINRMFALVMYHLLMTAFPKAVYNAEFVPEWNNEIGAAIPIHGTEIGTNIKNIAGYLEPGNMSSQIVQVLELAMQFTKETLGINDTSLGDVRPDNTSAIVAVQKSAAIPLENPKTNLYQMIEDIGEILLDMMGTKYGLRPLVMDVDVQAMQPDPMTGEQVPQLNPDGSPIMNKQKQIVEYDFSKLKDMFLTVRADVGESSFWSEISSNQTLTNLLSQQLIDVVQFLERTPDDQVPKKQELIQELKRQQQLMQQQQQQQMAMQQQQAEQQQQMNQAQQERDHNDKMHLENRKLDIEEQKAKASNKKK